MSVCTEIEVTGKSTKSWERAAAAAVKAASDSFADRCLVRVQGDGADKPTFTAEVVGLELKIENGHIERYIARVKVSFVAAEESAPRFSYAPGLSYAPRFSYAPPPRFFAG
jgi:flavin-binding protein dodecin